MGHAHYTGAHHQTTPVSATAAAAAAAFSHGLHNGAAHFPTTPAEIPASEATTTPSVTVSVKVMSVHVALLLHSCTGLGWMHQVLDDGTPVCRNPVSWLRTWCARRRSASRCQFAGPSSLACHLQNRAIDDVLASHALGICHEQSTRQDFFSCLGLHDLFTLVKQKQMMTLALV